MIGGPATTGGEDYSKLFLANAHKRGTPLDFFSWHGYGKTVYDIAERARNTRKLMDDNGYRNAKSYCTEWNYVKGWTQDWLYTLRVEMGDAVQKGAAHRMAMILAFQDSSVDLAHYYDARPNAMNGIFDSVTLRPMKGYYPFYAWSKLVDRGTQVACSVTDGTGADSNANTGFVERKDKSKAGGFRAVAAKGANGSGAVLIVRYSDNDNVSDTGKVTVRVPGVDLAKARCHLTDLVRTYTEVPLEPAADGAAVLRMQPLSFALIEY